MAYVDVIRMVLCALVIMVHAACTFGAAGDWTFTDPTANDMITGVLLTFFLLYCQSFFMGLFFFLSGYFTPGAVERKGLPSFWKDRFLRLAVPAAAYTLFLSRVPNYLREYRLDSYRGSFWQYTANTFWTQADAGPTWFLCALLLFAAGYTIWHLVNKIAARKTNTQTKLLPAPTTPILLVVGLVMAVGMFAVAQFTPVSEPYRIFGAIPFLLGFFPFYIILFVGGVLAYRNNWLERMSPSMLGFWKWMSIALIVALPVYLIGTGAIDLGIEAYAGGFSWRTAGLALWFGMACISFSTTLTLWMRGKVNPDSKMIRSAGPNTFGAYLIHPLVLVPITLVLSYTEIHPMIKFGVSSALTIPICFILAGGLRRIPGLKSVL